MAKVYNVFIKIPIEAIDKEDAREKASMMMWKAQRCATGIKEYEIDEVESAD